MSSLLAERMFKSKFDISKLLPKLEGGLKLIKKMGMFIHITVTF